MRSDKYKNKKSEFSFGGSGKAFGKSKKPAESVSSTKKVGSMGNDDAEFDFLDFKNNKVSEKVIESDVKPSSFRTSSRKETKSEGLLFDRSAFSDEAIFGKKPEQKTAPSQDSSSKGAFGGSGDGSARKPSLRRDLEKTSVFSAGEDFLGNKKEYNPKEDIGSMVRRETSKKSGSNKDSVGGEFVFDRSIFGEVDEEEIKRSERKFQKELKKQDKINRKRNKKRSRGRGKNKSVKANKSSKKSSVFKFLFVLLLTASVCCAGVFFYMHTKINKMDFIDTTPAEFCIDDGVAKSLKGYRNIAILGVDSRKGEGFDGVRSDAIIIASVNKKNNDVKLVSVLRDTHLLIGQGAEDYSDYYGLDKITHAFSYGGPVNTCSALNKALDLNIHEFIVMDWNSVADVVDIFGGLELDIQANELRDLNKWGPETAMNTDRTWDPIWETGKQKLDGAQVATYCRIRKTSGGDEGRTDRMKKVTIALLKTALENPTKIDKVLDTVLPEVQTNMGTAAFTSLLPRLAGFSITDSIGWPKDYYGGIINGKWLAVPQTLETNVVDLHKKAFGQENYVLSMQAQRINQQIISETGIQALP